MDKSNNIVNNNKFSLEFISLSLHISILVYVGIVFLLARVSEWPLVFQVLPDQSYLFLCLSIATGVSALLIVTWPMFTAPLPTNQEEALQYKAFKQKDLFEKLFYSFNNPTSDVKTKTLLRMAGSESIALFGIVLAIKNQSPLVVLPFAGIALILQFVFGPIFGRIRKKS